MSPKKRRNRGFSKVNSVSILHITDVSYYANIFTKLFEKLAKNYPVEYVRITLEEFAGSDGVVESDIVFYHTFPNEKHPTKFRTDLIQKTDSFFLLADAERFLLDSHEDWNKDGFPRFSGFDFKSLKFVPHKDSATRVKRAILTVPGYNVDNETVHHLWEIVDEARKNR